MRGVKAFLVWLFSFWTWFKAFFRLRWFKTPPLDQARLNTSPAVEQLHSNEGQLDSALATFLSSLTEGTTELNYSFRKDGFQILAYVDGGWREFLGDEPTHREFLAAVASSKFGSCKRITVNLSRRNFDSPKQLEEIVGALVSNNNFETARLSSGDCSTLQMAECVSNLLSGNKAIEDLEVVLYSGEGVGREAAELLAKGLRENRVLKSLDLWGIPGSVDDEAMEVLMKPLKENDSVLQHLRLRKMTDVGLEHVGVMLRTNTSLKTLGLWDSGRVYDRERRDEVYMRGFTSLKEALGINRTLKSLRCPVASSTELKALVEPLVPMNNNPQANVTLTTLDLSRSRIGGEEGVDILADMLRTNTSLSSLGLYSIRELDDGSSDGIEKVVAILEALKTNKSLKTVGIQDCDGVSGYKVLGMMMDLLLENRQLEEINVRNTPLESSGDAQYVHSELEKRKKMKLWDLVKGMANVSPRSGRVFLCGDPFAGKTTLRQSMKELSEFQKGGSSQLSLVHQWKNKIFKKDSKVPKAKSTNERTRGIEVDHVECDGIDISIWDMAGQVEYHSFHDLVIPNLSADGSCSLFLLVCNPMQGGSFVKRNISDIKSEIEYWLRFIASNTRRSWSYRPHVSIVMTHFDYWKDEIDFATRIEDVIEELRVQFEEVLEFDFNRKMFKVYGEDREHARTVFDFIKSHMKQLLQRLPKTIKACSEVQCLIAKWNAEVSKQSSDGKSPKVPMLKWEEFSGKICKEIEELQNEDKELAQRKQEFVAIALNDGGHIMYHEEGKFVITNPHWFCHDIMGEFLHHCANVESQYEMVSIHGMIKIEHVNRILEKIVGSQEYENMVDAVLRMMIKLNFCYEQDDKSIMIPSTLRDKCQSLTWPAMHESTRFTYVGRRLSCKDAMRTMLSLGFFPRLQVSFFKKFQNNNIGNSYQLFQDIIMFICDGIEVILEFDHVNIDILLRSEQCQDKMLEFYENGIVRHIQDLLVNPTLGCPGVILVEHILRPKCVQHLIDPKNRNNQFVSLEELELEVMTSGFEARHNWKQCVHLGVGYDRVEKLMGNKAWKQLLQRRHNALQRYQREISRTSVPNNSLICKDEMNNAQSSLVWQILPRCMDFVMKGVHIKLDNIDKKMENCDKKMDNFDRKMDNFEKKMDVAMRKMDDIFHMQEDIMKMQDTLLQEVSSKIDDWMEFSIEMQQLQVPKLVYLSEVGKKKLLTHFVPGLVEFELHVMCESRSGIHAVENQEGCKVKFGTNGTRTFVTMLVWGLKIATILVKIGAHVAGGMGGLVPNFGADLQLAGLILDTPNLLDQISASCLPSLPDDLKRNPQITHDDRSKAQTWLIKFLEPKCKEESTFYQMFKLKKVVYRVGSKQKPIAWLCDECVRNGIQSGILYCD